MPRPALAFLLGLLWFGALHAAEPRLADYDGYFHVRFASMGPAAWLGHDFPWMPGSVFADGRWVDHQWLFHALIWPFTKVLPLLEAAHASAAVFAAGMLAAFTWVLGTRDVPRPVLWSVALLGASRFFDDRMLMPRTQALSLAFLFVGVGLAMRGRTRALIALGVLFAWTYHVSLMLIPTVAVASFSARRGLGPALGAALGVGLGYLVHPQTPYTFAFLGLHVFEKVLNPTGQAVGAEWMPVDTRTWVIHVAPLFLLALGGLARTRRAAPDTRALALLALGWTLASFTAVKWLEYAVPFGLLAIACLWRDNGFSLAPLWLGLPLSALHASQVLDHVRTTLPPADRFEALARHLPATDCHVFHADWTDFSELFYAAPQCSYVVGLDPHFLSASDPKRAALVEAALAGRVAALGDMARQVWGASWVVTTNPAMEAAARADAGLEERWSGEGAALFEVRQP